MFNSITAAPNKSLFLTSLSCKSCKLYNEKIKLIQGLLACLMPKLDDTRDISISVSL